MNSILERLYFGDINPNVANRVTANGYQKDIETFIHHQELLTELLANEEKKLMLEMSDAESSIMATQNISHFVNGFRLGARMMLEVMTDEQNYLM